MIRKSIRDRRQRKQLNKSFDLLLTPLLDVLVIVLVFLLKSASVSFTQFTKQPGIELPYSLSPDTPPDALHLVITPEAMTFEEVRILDFIQTLDSLGSGEAGYRFKNIDLAEGGRLIRPLYDALSEARNASEILRKKSLFRDQDGKPLEFFGELAIQADKRISYDTLRRVMYTAAAAGFRVFHMLAEKRE